MNGWNYLISVKDVGHIGRLYGTHHHINPISSVCDIYLDDIRLISLEYETIDVKEECIETEVGCVQTCRIIIEAKQMPKTYTWK